MSTSVTFHPTTGFDGTFTVAGSARLSHGQAWRILTESGIPAREADRLLADARRR